MKYRILIKAGNLNVSSLGWYSEFAAKGPVWETEDDKEAVQKYQKLLDTNSANNLTLVQIIPVDIVVSTVAKEHNKHHSKMIIVKEKTVPDDQPEEDPEDPEDDELEEEG